MHDEQRPREQGQTLVMLALVMTVLMLMVGMAVDVGMAYNDRRDLQNAADAAALAAAQQLCDGKGEAAAQWASESMGMINGAAEVETQFLASDTALSVRVVVRNVAETFFFRLVGIEDVPVSAAASAECSCAASVGGAWPIAFDKPQWEDSNMGCIKSNGDIQYGDGGGGPYLLIWVDDNVDTHLGDDLCVFCDCQPLKDTLGIDSIMAYGGNPFGSGDRGWVRLLTPSGFESDPVWGGENNCGSALKTWMEFGYPGQLGMGDCVPTASGVDNAALQAANASKFKDVAVIIYDPHATCTAGDLVDGDKSCSGDWLNVAGYGCIQVHKVYQSSDTLSLKEIGGTKDCTLGKVNVKNLKAIVAAKMCDCPYSGSGSSGGPHSMTCVPAVSLVE